MSLNNFFINTFKLLYKTQKLRNFKRVKTKRSGSLKIILFVGFNCKLILAANGNFGATNIERVTGASVSALLLFVLILIFFLKRKSLIEKTRLRVRKTYRSMKRGNFSSRRKTDVVTVNA